MKLHILSTLLVISFAIFIENISGSAIPTLSKKVQSDNERRTTGGRMHPEDIDLKAFVLNRPEEVESEFWIDNAKDFVEQQLKKTVNVKKAKNIIIFLGDGMSVSTFSAARVYMGGEEKQLSFEKFPHTGLSKTYCVDYQVADSACTGTAYLNGVKANYGTLGVSAKVPRYHCTAQLDASTHTESIAKWALNAGKSAGIVTTASITDASPAAAYAHSANRYWENDADVVGDRCDPNVIDDIAKQLIHGDVGSKLQVIMGGGRANFRDAKSIDEESRAGYRDDGRDLVDEYLQLKSNAKAKFIWNTTDLLNVKADETDYLLGLFEHGALMYNLDVERNNLQAREPSLAQMTDRAIDILSKNEEGFFLFVEGQKIDSAHHSNHARYALDETSEFSKAIELARNKLSEEDTLIVVTSDHSHTYSYSGYTARNSDIFGINDLSNMDNLPYMTSGYANGGGFENNMDGKTGRKNLTEIDTTSNSFRFPSTLPLGSETHGGEDVAVFASGPWSHLFTGVFEENVIPIMMAYASCIGGDDFLKSCD